MELEKFGSSVFGLEEMEKALPKDVFSKFKKIVKDEEILDKNTTMCYTWSVIWSVTMTVRFHLFPFRTQQLSSLVPKIVSWKRLVKIGSRRLDRNALREILGRFCCTLERKIVS